MGMISRLILAALYKMFDAFFAIAIPRANNTKTMASIEVVTWDNHFSIYIADHAVAEASDVDQLAAGKEGEGAGWGGEPAYRSQPIYYL